MTILQAQNISKRFGSAEVLKDVSFSLDEGEVLAVIGTSGSGKTTLLRCLNFLERIDQGSIAVRGKTLVSSDDPRAYHEANVAKNRLHFGIVFQSFHLFPQYTALQNVTLAPQLLAKRQPDYKSDKKAILAGIHQEAVDLLEQVGLSERQDYYPHQLSGGQQQRVAIARALALKPDILCFDEPTSALDPELTDEVLKVIRGLAEKHTTMLIVTHEMQFARQVADKVLFMDDGTVIEYGTPQEVFEASSHERTKKFLERYSAEG